MPFGGDKSAIDVARMVSTRPAAHPREAQPPRRSNVVVITRQQRNRAHCCTTIRSTVRDSFLADRGGGATLRGSGGRSASES